MSWIKIAKNNFPNVKDWLNQPIPKGKNWLRDIAIENLQDQGRSYRDEIVSKKVNHWENKILNKVPSNYLVLDTVYDNSSIERAGKIEKIINKGYLEWGKVNEFDINGKKVYVWGNEIFFIPPGLLI